MSRIAYWGISKIRTYFHFFHHNFNLFILCTNVFTDIYIIYLINIINLISNLIRYNFRLVNVLSKKPAKSIYLLWNILQFVRVITSLSKIVYWEICKIMIYFYFFNFNFGLFIQMFLLTSSLFILSIVNRHTTKMEIPPNQAPSYKPLCYKAKLNIKQILEQILLHSFF